MNFNIKNEIKIYNYIKMAPISNYIIHTLNFIPNIITLCIKLIHILNNTEDISNVAHNNIKVSMNITQIKYIL